MRAPIVPEPLTSAEVERYSRQLLLPSFGVDGQLALHRARVLIVGLGGLGCPSALYLAGAGVGCLGLVDIPGEVVAVSNLHRQIAHNTAGAETALPKTESLKTALNALNPHVAIELHEEFTSKSAVELCGKYDVVLDCSDNVATRYLTSDACAAAGAPLVSGAALGTDGQCSVMCPTEASPDTPCYRCVFPTPPPAACVGACDSAGVLGPVTGIVGSIMALEAMKLLAMPSAPTLGGRLLIVDGMHSEFRTVKLRPRKKCCEACGENRTLDVINFDYKSFESQGAAVKPILEDSMRISVSELHRLRQEEAAFLLLDVRPDTEFRICSLEGSISVPINTLDDKKASELVAEHSRVVVICRRGNKSQAAALRLLQAGANDVVDVRGGLQAWHREVDLTFPLY